MLSESYEVETDTLVLVDSDLKEIYDKIFSRHYVGFDKPNNWLEASAEDKEELKQAYIAMMATKRPGSVDGNTDRSSANSKG